MLICDLNLVLGFCRIRRLAERLLREEEEEKAIGGFVVVAEGLDL